MKKPTPSRTIGPVHFEDLEPHRFEDLVRQLSYDFRPWKRLEPTGRSGSDDGFDARGIEGGTIASDGADSDDTDSDPEEVASTQERVWLIQCKREKAIGPKKLIDYLDGIPADERGQLYGIIFAAACEFSKAARDKFREKTREMGVSEAYLWGKADIEDMLYQPKNDHLLFAYFGISLQMRRRSLRTDIRARLATKKKAIKCLESRGNDVLIRDASDDRYPYREHDKEGERLDQGRWLVAQFDKCRHDGIHFLRRRHLAFIHDDGIAWDFSERNNDAIPHDDPWRTDDEEKEQDRLREIRDEAFQVWDALPANNKAWFELFGILPYESVIALDEDGDDRFKKPHIYTIPFTSTLDLFRNYVHFSLRTIGQWDARWAKPDPEKRIKIFPEEGDTPRPPKKQGMPID